MLASLSLFAFLPSQAHVFGCGKLLCNPTELLCKFLSDPSAKKQVSVRKSAKGVQFLLPLSCTVLYFSVTWIWKINTNPSECVISLLIYGVALTEWIWSTICLNFQTGFRGIQSSWADLKCHSRNGQSPFCGTYFVCASSFRFDNDSFDFHS